LHIQKLADGDRTIAINKEIKDYEILRLIMEWHDQKIFALGRASVNQKMLLLELTVPRSETEKVSVKELAQLPTLSYDGEFTGQLSDEKGDKYVLIASIASANRHAIYRVRLPGIGS
jgi:hypothetical protein